VAAHAFRRLGEVSVASQPSLPGWDAFMYSLTSFRAMPGVNCAFRSHSNLCRRHARCY
jgi:hypothetical protein